MKQLFIISLLFGISSHYFAQQVLDTVFYSIYGNSQLLAIQQKQWYPPTKAFISTAKSNEELKNLPIYILRNSSGDVVKTFNDFKSIDKANFTNRNLHKEEPVVHRLKTKNTATSIGNDDSGYNQLYPVYSCQFNDYQVCTSFKVGLIDTLGDIVFPIEFDHIQYVDSTFIVKKNNYYFLYDAFFRPINSVAYDSVSYSDFVHNQLIVKKDGLYGLLNRNGTFVLPINYKSVQKSRYMNGSYEFLSGKLYGFISWDGKKYMPPFTPSASTFVRDGYFIYKDENWNVIDSTGKLILKTPLQVFNIINKNRFVVGPNYHERALVDAKNVLISDKYYHDIWKVDNHVLMIGYDAGKIDASELIKSAKWQLVDMNFNKVNSTVFRSIQVLDEHFLRAYDLKNNLLVTNHFGEPVLDFAVSDVYKFADGVYKLIVDGKHLFIDLKNQAKRSRLYDNLQCVKENRIAVQKDGLWGFINFDFVEICPIKANRVSCFEDGIATIELEKQFYIMDSTGKLLSPEYFDFVENVRDGYCRVGRNGKYGLIYKSGVFTVPMEYEENNFLAKHKGHSYLSVRQKKEGGKYGIINERNELVYPFIFDKCVEISVHASIEQRRYDGFFAFATIEKRSTLEYYYLNFDDKKNQVKIQVNPSKGFKIVEETCEYEKGKTTKCFGVKNWMGQQIIPTIYFSVKPLDGHLFTVYGMDGGGMLDTNGKVVIPVKYKYLYELCSDCDFVQVGRHSGGWGLYRKDGKQLTDTIYGGFEKPVFNLIPFRSHPNYHFNENKEWVHDEQKLGFMDFEGNVVIAPGYDRYQIPNQKKEEILVNYGTKWLRINGNGELLEGEFAPSTKIATVKQQPKRKWWQFWKRKGPRWK